MSQNQEPGSPSPENSDSNSPIPPAVEDGTPTANSLEQTDAGSDLVSASSEHTSSPSTESPEHQSELLGETEGQESVLASSENSDSNVTLLKEGEDSPPTQPLEQAAVSAQEVSTSTIPSEHQARLEEGAKEDVNPSATATVPADKGSYTERTDRIQAISQLIRSLQPLIWGAVILVVVIPLVGKFLIAKSIPVPGVEDAVTPSAEVVVEARPDLSQVDAAMVEAIEAAHAKAEAFAAKELAGWEEELTPRVDGFLDWYFDYFNQKKLEFSAPFAWLTSAAFHAIDTERPTAGDAVATKFTEEFQREFAKRVLVPRNAQIKLEILTTEMVDLYLAELKKNIAVVQNQYQIPQGQWERYLSDISTTINDTEGNISTLSLKVLVGGSGYLLAKPLVLGAVGKIGSKVSAKFASQAAAKMAAKTGGVVAAEFGTTLVDPIVGVGIFIWDFWDYNHTVTVERPILRANLLEYLQDVQRSLLTNPESGIMTAINQLEGGILDSL